MARNGAGTRHGRPEPSERLPGSPEQLPGSPEQLPGSRWNGCPGAVGTAARIAPDYAIFPRVLRNSKSRETIGEVDHAIGGYEGIVADFGALGLEELLDEDMPLDSSSRAILASVYEACQRLTELTASGPAEVQELKAKLEQRLQEEP